MEEEAAPENKMEDLDIENMKVTELKKKLKDNGLPTTGNKSELVERLQGSILAAKNAASSNPEGNAASDPGGNAASDPGDKATPNPGDNAASDPGEPVSSSSELDSSLLNDSSKLSISSTEPEEKDNAKICDNELNVSSEKSKESPATTNALKPLKKRFVAPTSDGSSEKKPKKIVLKRNNVPTPKFIPNKPSEPLENKNVVTCDKSDVTKCKDSKEEIVSASPIKEGSNKINLKAAKNISANERFNMRAKRFNIITAPEPVSKSGKIIITSKKNQASSDTSTLSSTSAAHTVVATPQQRRIQRFGINFSKVVPWDKQQPDGLKRKIYAEDQEKKRRRAERFGLI
ncbi:uncharacterized protein LOC129960126 isoform X5 [Argiope bruennichi]|uniref:uncharacterized protein LOC129960126 isoform X5 n=1 Tax=Argiope bruennichi TaxID=94029 RepID=UPI002493D799|nr:uncharacterized protein LOC129960126 isoform X5 [Argiope bruennichi]